MDYLKTLTDDTGVFQHAMFCVPKRTEGYTTDDNARALIACTQYHRLKGTNDMKELANIYLSFLNHMQKPDGNLHNYLGYERRYLDVDGSEESFGRTLWSCGVVVNSNLLEDQRMVAKNIFDKTLPWVWKSTWLRFYASTVFGLAQYNQVYPSDDVRFSVSKLADCMVQRYRDEVRDNWHWFEPSLTYDNARLPQALFEAYSVLGKKEYLEVAQESMDFLVKTTVVEDVFAPIGNDGWFLRGRTRAFYDQQPLEAAAMVDAAIDGYKTTKDNAYLQVAQTAFEWYLGRNSRKITMYNESTGGCYDGLNRDSINKNQGAESSISYLLARLKMQMNEDGFSET
jgi:hypothetical protein